MWVNTTISIAVSAFLAGSINASAAPAFLDCKVLGQTGITEHVTFWFDGTMPPKSFNLSGTDQVVLKSDIKPNYVTLISKSAFNGNEIWFTVDRFNKAASLAFITREKLDTEDSPYSGKCDVSDKAPKPAF